MDGKNTTKTIDGRKVFDAFSGRKTERFSNFAHLLGSRIVASLSNNDAAKTLLLQWKPALRTCTRILPTVSFVPTRKSSYFFSKINRRCLIRTPVNTDTLRVPLVSVLTGFHCIMNSCCFKRGCDYSNSLN